MTIYTIRNNKNKSLKIITFKREFYEKLMSSNANAVNLFLSTLLNHINSISNKNHVYDFSQMEMFNTKLNEVKTIDDHKLHYINKWFVNGITINDVQNDVYFDILCKYTDLIFNK